MLLPGCKAGYKPDCMYCKQAIKKINPFVDSLYLRNSGDEKWSVVNCCKEELNTVYTIKTRSRRHKLKIDLIVSTDTSYSIQRVTYAIPGFD